MKTKLHFPYTDSKKIALNKDYFKGDLNAHLLKCICLAMLHILFKQAAQYFIDAL